VRRLLIVLLVLALPAGACTSSRSDSSSVSRSATTALEETADPGSVAGSGLSVVPGAGSEGGEIPPLPILTPAEAIVEPGATVAISADPRLSGTVVMSGSAGDAASAILRAGKAILTVPPGVAEGAYQLQLAGEGDTSAFGVIGVSDGPGLWLSAPAYVLPDEEPEVLVTTHGIPSGMVAALEVTAGDGVAERLVPHPLLGLAPITTTTTVGLPDGSGRWALPPGFVGDVRVVAGRPGALDPFLGDEADPALVSEVRTLRSCDSPGAVVGDLGASGVIRATWMAAGPESASAVAEDGSFALEVRPGSVLVSAYTDTGKTVASPMVVRVKCGETVDIGAADEPVDTGPTPGEFLGGLTLDDLFMFTAESSGGLAIGSKGLSECSMSRGALEVTLDPEASTEPRLYKLEVEEFDGTGRFDGVFSVVDIFTDESSVGAVTVEAELATIDGIDAIGGAFTGDIAGALGEGSLEVEFSCALFGGLEVLARRSVPATPQAVNAMWPEWLGGKRTEPCRIGVAFTNVGGAATENGALAADLIAANLTVRLANAAKKVSWTTQGDIKSMMASEAQRQLLGGDDEGALMAAIAEAVGADFLLTAKVAPFEGKWVAIVRLIRADPAGVLEGVEISTETLEALPAAVGKEWRKFKNALKRAAICGKSDPDQVSPTKGGKTQVGYEVTDLEGEPVEATVDKVESECGSFSPDSGRAADHRVAPGDPPPALEAIYRRVANTVTRFLAGTFTTTLTGEVAGCTDEVTFVARAQGPSGELTTERDAEESTLSIAIPMFEFKVTIDVGEGAQTLHSESTGLFFVEPDFNQVIGAGDGATQWEVPDFPCIVISESGVDERTQLFTGDGSFQVMPVGELASGDVKSSGTVRFIPRGYLSSITVSYSDPDCFPPGTSTNDPFGIAILGIWTFYPHIIAGELQGFEVPFNADGTRTSRTWQFIESPGSVTIEVWAAQAGADST